MVKTNHAIHWIVIYPVDSVIQPLNDWGLVWLLVCSTSYLRKWLVNGFTAA